MLTGVAEPEGTSQMVKPGESAWPVASISPSGLHAKQDRRPEPDVLRTRQAKLLDLHKAFHVLSQIADRKPTQLSCSITARGDSWLSFHTALYSREDERRRSEPFQGAFLP